MSRYILVMSLLSVSACGAIASERIIHNDFFGDMKVVKHSEKIRFYDEWAQKSPKSLVENFMNLCCDLTVTKIPEVHALWRIKTKLNKSCITLSRWTKDALEKELIQIIKKPNGEDLLKVIASTYIKDPNLAKVCFFTANIDSKILYGEHIASAYNSATQSIVYVDKTNKKQKGSLFLKKDGSVSLGELSKNYAVTHEIIHWKDDILGPKMNIEPYGYINDVLYQDVIMRKRISNLVRKITMGMTDKQKEQIFGNRYKDFTNHEKGTDFDEHRKAIFHEQYDTAQTQDARIYMDFITLLDRMIGIRAELRCMYGVIVDDKCKAIGWDPINEMTTNVNDDIRVSHLSLSDKREQGIISFVAQMLQKYYRFYTFEECAFLES